MITVANRTETAARVKHAFDQRKILIEELCALTVGTSKDACSALPAQVSCGSRCGS